MTEPSGGAAAWFNASGVRVGIVVAGEGQAVRLDDWPWPTVALGRTGEYTRADFDSGALIRVLYTVAEVPQRGDHPLGGMVTREVHNSPATDRWLWPVIDAGLIMEVLAEVGIYPNMLDVMAAVADLDNTD